MILWMVAKSCISLDGWNPVNNGINHLSIGAGCLPSTVSQATGYELRFGVLKVYADTFRQQSMDAFWQNVLRNSTDKDANKKKHDAKSQGFGLLDVSVS